MREPRHSRRWIGAGDDRHKNREQRDQCDCRQLPALRMEIHGHYSFLWGIAANRVEWRHTTPLADNMRVITRGCAVAMTATRRKTVRRNAQELKAAAYPDVQRCISERRRRARDNARSSARSVFPERYFATGVHRAHRSRLRRSTDPG